MCSRYALVSKIRYIEQQFNATIFEPELYQPSYNISPGKKALVITSQDPQTLQFFQFGFTPSWANKQMYLLNARAEGDLNKDDNPQYQGDFGIFQKPAFREAIQFKRCLVVADCFYEGTKEEGLDKASLVYLRNRKAFAFGGIYSSWTNPKNGTILNSFAIVTTRPNDLMLRIGHHRCPVILSKSDETKWLQTSSPITEIQSLFMPFSSELMNAYPVSAEIKSSKNEGRNLVEPIGERIFLE